MFGFLLVEASIVTLTNKKNLLRNEEKREKRIWKVIFIEAGVLKEQIIFTMCYIDGLADAVLELKRVVDSWMK